jgi:hypothetical protein
MRRELLTKKNNDDLSALVGAINNELADYKIYIAKKFDNSDYLWVRGDDGSLYKLCLFKADGTLVAKTSGTFTLFNGSFLQTWGFITDTTTTCVFVDRVNSNYAYYVCVGTFDTSKPENGISITKSSTTKLPGTLESLSFAFVNKSDVGPKDSLVILNGTSNNEICTIIDPSLDITTKYLSNSSYMDQIVYYDPTTLDLYGREVAGYSGAQCVIKQNLVTNYINDSSSYNKYNWDSSVTYRYSRFWPVFRYENTIDCVNKSLLQTYNASPSYQQKINIDILNNKITTSNYFTKWSDTYGVLTNGEVWYSYNTSSGKVEPCGPYYSV